MSTRFAIAATLALLACCGGPPPPSDPPRDLDQALARLEGELSAEEKRRIAAMTEDRFLGEEHMRLGMRLRDEWGLWKNGRSVLQAFFEARGIGHPDDMSSIVLASLWRRLNGRPVDLHGQIACYERYWEDAEERHQDAAARGESSWPAPGFTCPSGLPRPQPPPPRRSF